MGLTDNRANDPMENFTIRGEKKGPLENIIDELNKIADQAHSEGQETLCDLALLLRQYVRTQKFDSSVDLDDYTSGQELKA